MTFDPPDSRREWIAIAALTLLGAVFRFWGTDRLGLDHFDEGIYAFAGLWIADPRGLSGLDPGVIAYAPPGFPILVGLSYLLFGIGDLAAIFVSQFLGVLTIPVVGWIGRRTFGPGAGAAAAALAAVSGPHIVFSRMALTDASALLGWLLAIVAGGAFLERPGWIRALSLGTAVGIAQNLKYNGALTGLIVAIAAVVGLVLGPEERRRSLRALGFGGLAALVAAVTYWPWFRFVADHGGYGALLRHQRGYLGGPSSWLSHWRIQSEQSIALAGVIRGPMTWWLAAWPLAVLAGAFSANGPRLVSVARPHGWSRLRLGLLGGAVALGAMPNLAWWAGLIVAPVLIVDRRPRSRIIGAWWLLMSALTPFYHPYARLWLPIHAVGWLILSGLIVRFGPFDPGVKVTAADPSRLRRWRILGAVAALIVLALAIGQRGPIAADRFGLPRGPIPNPEILNPTDSLRLAVDQFKVMPNRPRGPIPVLVRPPVLFYLALIEIPVRREPDLGSLVRDAAPGSMVLVDRVQLEQEPDPMAAAHRSSQRFEMIKPIPYRLSPATLLDIDPSAARGEEGHSLRWTDLMLLRTR
jgi:dolichyl-phosphate-mannose-protein mannosyltransferase